MKKLFAILSLKFTGISEELKYYSTITIYFPLFLS